MRWALLAIVAACSSDPAPTGWDAVSNPVLSFDDVAIKDAFAVHRDGTWYFGYSRITETPFRVRLGFSTSRDLKTFAQGEVIDQAEVGGLASPDVQRRGDEWVMTYNSHTNDVGTDANKLYWRTSSDLRAWSSPHRFHMEGADAAGDRLIDAALAFTDTFALLFFKREQTANVAVSANGSLDGPWTLLGSVNPGDVENMQILSIDGTFHLLATTLLPHRPNLYRLDGDPHDAQSFRKWTLVRELDVPEQSWNTGEPLLYERDNASYIVDDRATDGFFYLVYAGSTELQTYGNRGHVKLGLARSRDLSSWEPAGEKVTSGVTLEGVRPSTALKGRER